MATTPDLICLVDTETFRPVTTDAMKYGKRVMAVGMKCFHLWRTEKGIELVGPRYFGVELEIDGAGEDSYNAEQVLKLANRGDEYIYCKHDGSLDEGFEIVTHPMTLDFQERSMPWLDLVRKAVSMGYTSHQANTCGLHVHVSRTAFGDYEDQQDAVIARILYFFEKHWEELLKFSRRTENQLQRWAAP